jgi:WhiB family redox-sensing transcriptional regulator
MNTAHTRHPGRSPAGSTDWQYRAACRDVDPELFFPVGNAGPALIQIGKAKQVCARCPVRRPCLQWALGSGQDTGVWGGTSEEERRALRRQRGEDQR